MEYKQSIDHSFNSIQWGFYFPLQDAVVPLCSPSNPLNFKACNNPVSPQCKEQFIEANPDEELVDITDMLAISQKEAAKKLGIAHSTLSKRWKEVNHSNRKWPYKRIQKIDREISSILQNTKEVLLSQETSEEIWCLVEKRTLETRQTWIRLPKKQV